MTGHYYVLLSLVAGPEAEAFSGQGGLYRQHAVAHQAGEEDGPRPAALAQLQGPALARQAAKREHLPHARAHARQTQAQQAVVRHHERQRTQQLHGETDTAARGKGPLPNRHSNYLISRMNVTFNCCGYFFPKRKDG